MKHLRPNLMVKDVNATIAWYADVFGAQTLVTVPETGAFDFAILKMGDVELMVEKAESLSEGISALQGIGIGGSFTLYTDVEDVDALYAKAKEKNVEIVKDMHETFYGTREFYMKDCNGYIWTLAQTK